ncbi:heavy metal sensor histidine kinase [Achromobacter sp. JD-1]|uniref:heavy metal sensor histidine kinase n=1 Tax=Achromobacter TaxID=222 RepID=UPI00315B3797
MGKQPRSLRRWLSQRLAIQTFIALSLVCIAVYYATNLNLARRQDALMQQKVEVVRHVVEENGADGDSARMQHKLEDFFYGRPEFTLVLEVNGKPVVFGNPLDNDADRERSISFLLPHPGTPGGSLTARLVLDISEDVRLRRGLAWTLFACALLGSLVVATMGTITVRMALTPLDSLAQQAAKLSPDRIGERLNEAGQAIEILPLVRQFNAVLQRLERAYVQMEGFNADVAHEMRTPLTTLIGETELALRTRPDRDALLDILGSNLEELERLSSIVKDMLFLSQADRGARVRGAWEHSIAAIVHEVSQYHEAEALEAGVSIVVEGDAASRIDRPLFQRAVSNLLSNAIRYATPKSVITISLSNEKVGEVVLAVCNEGAPIAPEHLPRLFYRFYRTDSSREFEANHHGLGLAIVAAIARMHGGTTFAQSAGRHTTIGFRIDVPCPECELEITNSLRSNAARKPSTPI